MTLGVLFVYSATMVTESAMTAPLIKQKWLLQIVWYALGLAAAGVLCCVNYHTLARWASVAYWVGIILLFVVLFAGTVRFGARRWFDLRVFMFQPSEFAKLAFIMAMANFLSRPAEELRDPMIFWKAIGMMLLPFVLILKEPDLGSALVLLPVGLTMLFVAGTPRHYLGWLLGGVGCLAALFLVDVLFAPPGWWQIKLEEYQRQRLRALRRFSRSKSGRGRDAAPKILPGPPGPHLRRLRRIAGQRVAQRKPDRARLFAAWGGA